MADNVKYKADDFKKVDEKVIRYHNSENTKERDMLAFYDSSGQGTVIRIPNNMLDKNVPRYTQGNNWRGLQGEELDAVLAKLKADDDEEESQAAAVEPKSSWGLSSFLGRKKAPAAEDEAPHENEESEEEKVEEAPTKPAARRHKMPATPSSNQRVNPSLPATVNAGVERLAKKRQASADAAEQNANGLDKTRMKAAVAAKLARAVAISQRNVADSLKMKKTQRANAAQLQLNSVIRATQGEFHF